jgi:predicted nucleic acid-binding protein
MVGVCLPPFPAREGGRGEKWEPKTVTMGDIMKERVKRIYVDASTALGMFDANETRRQQTKVFWDAVRNGEVIALLSDVLNEEAKSEHVRDFLAELPKFRIKWIDATVESDALAQRYIDQNVVSMNSLNDCRHVALATLENADGIVSWNLGDMVKRAKKYNSVNAAHGHREIKIVTPNKYEEIYNEK